MLKAFSVTAFLVTTAALPFGAAEATLQERPAPLMTPLEHVRDPLRPAFRRLSEANGGEWGGGRDKAYHHIDDAAKHLIAAIKASNAAFREGRRELPLQTGWQ